MKKIRKIRILDLWCPMTKFIHLALLATNHDDSTVHDEDDHQQTLLPPPLTPRLGATAEQCRDV